MRLVVAAAFCAVTITPLVAQPAPTGAQSCFLLFETGVGEVRRNPSTSCSTRVSPQSTFKIPHALAAVDAAVIADASSVIKYDAHPVDFPAWQKDHTLETAMRFSVVWYFQEIARRLGVERERAYLDKFDYGNRDSSSGLTTFWLGGSLKISPEEELAFVRKLYANQLAVTARAADIIRQVLIQPNGMIVNATGEHPFAQPWPNDAVVSAKTGAGPTGDGRAVRWLVGRVTRGAREWFFVSNVVSRNDLPAMAAVEQAERALVDARVLR
jgi:beta-lactamase class D